ncbi:MAG: hypothetical protein NTW50_05455 [Candidatus Berkelbacteria bacterium]|nr:hypothetical protein [Candidatus Berkelbacteria bacterium]
MNSQILEIGRKKSDLDLALRDEKPDAARGLACQRQIIEIIESLKTAILIENLGLETYNFLVEQVGSNEELESRISALTIGGDTAEELQAKLEAVDPETGNCKFQIDNKAQSLLNKMYQSEEFKKLVQNQKNIQTIRLKVSDLGFTGDGDRPTADQLFARAFELGLEFCPAEVGPYLRIKNTEHLDKCRCCIAMNTIMDQRDEPRIFYISYATDIHSIHFLQLHTYWADHSTEFLLFDEFMFRLRGQKN